MFRAIIASGSLLIGGVNAEIKIKKEDESLKVYDGEKLVTEYHAGKNFPYLYPLVGPNGTTVTRHFPMKKGVANEAKDHPHHKSFWFTHGDVNGHDFWHSPDHQSTIMHLEFGEVTEDSFTANLVWMADGNALLNESRKYRFEKIGGNSLFIGVTSVLSSNTDVTFGDTKEGSFAIRVAPSLRHKGDAAKGNILNSEGNKDNDAWGKPARWVSYYGPDTAGKPTVVTMMDHPKNLNHPTHWHARNYGLLTANPFGEKSFTKKGDGSHLLKINESMTQRYGLLLQAGELDKEAIEKCYEKFGKKG